MDIRGRKPTDCYHAFVDHLSSILGRTLVDTSRCSLEWIDDDPLPAVAFRDAKGAVLDTRLFGRVFFTIRHVVRTRDEKGECVLETAQYQYAIHDNPEEDALIRWEYDPAQVSAKRPRFHMHLHQTGESLHKLHLPTGRVPLEEVIRFIVAEMGAPPRSDDWSEILSKSEEEFVAASGNHHK